MAAAYVQSKSGRVMLGTVASTASMNTTTGNALIIGAGLFLGSGSAFTSVTDNDGGTAPALDVQSPGGTNVLRVYSKFSVTAKNGYVASETFTGSGYASICVHEVSGLAASSQLDKTASALALTCTTAALSQNDEYAFGVGNQSASLGWSVTSSGWTQRENTETGAVANDIISGDNIVSNGAAQIFTISAGTSAAVALATYKATAGGATRGLFLPPNLNGLGSGGSFFGDRL